MTYRKWILISVLLGVLAGCGERYSSGDRVLVSKCSYDNGFTSPNRYDVCVFKFPDKPVKNNTPTNYIKRLLGLPGELIAIFFGRVYRWTPKAGDPAPFNKLPFNDLEDEKGNKTDIDPKTLREPKYMHVDDATSRQWFDEGRFEILRKPPQTMLALRRIVYDNDFQARDLKGKMDRWNPTPKSRWKSDTATGFIHEGKTNEVDWLTYQHLIHDWTEPLHGGMKVAPQLINNSMDYNSFDSTSPQNRIKSQRHHWVGDLMLECNVEVVEPRGEFWFELSKGIFRYQARFDLGSGQCTLFRVGLDGKREELGSQPTAVKAAGSYMLRFANVDARLTVWVDRSLPFGDGKEYRPPEIFNPATDKPDADLTKRRGPVKDHDLDRPASLGSKDAQVKVSHVRLWRDTYYITRIAQWNATDYDQEGAMAEDQNGPSPWSDPTRWEPIRNQRKTTMYVQPGHYLCLGDNSQASSDGRDWGLVPERLMLGRALTVYFPLERMGPIR